MIHLSAPECLLIIPAALGLAWAYRPLRRPLRMALTALAAFVLAGPSIETGARGIDLWVLADRSASCADEFTRRFPEWLHLLERHQKPEDKLTVVDFADVAAIRGETDEAHFARQPEESRIRLAVETALASHSRKRQTRFLLLSDGLSTEPLQGLAEKLGSERVPLDLRFFSIDAEGDFRISQLTAPQRVQEGEPILLEAQVSGETTGDVPVRVTRGDKILHEGKVYLHDGPFSGKRGILRFTDRSREPGLARYRVEVIAPEDPRRGNNFDEAWVEVEGEPVVLLLGATNSGPLQKALVEAGFRVRTTEAVERLSESSLAGVRAVILNNVAAHRFPREFLTALRFFVNHQGGGLLMIGGRNSFGSGGYFQSPVDELLPVSMELREETRRLSVAMAMVLDRSGSMSMTVAGNMGNLRKIDLANEGVARSLEFLSGEDQLSIIAVDSEAHIVAPMQKVESNRANLERLARSVDSNGGGIFVGEALKAGWKQLQRSPSKQRHFILFSDAADSEEPADYKETLKEITDAGGTVTVIGLGSPADSDAKLLQEVAELGKGRIYFVGNAMDLPAVFAQETVTFARSTFVKDPTPTAGTPSWRELSSTGIRWLGEVDGYNLSYLKPSASAAAITTDEYKAPLVAFWQRGTGRVAAVSFPLDGEFSERSRRWPEYAPFVATVTRWIRGIETPPGIALSSDLAGNTATVALSFDESWENRFSATPPVLAVTSSDGAVANPVWSNVEPGRFEAVLQGKPGQAVRGAVQIGEFSLPFGPILFRSNDEWVANPLRIAELRQISHRSGGKERLDLKDVWEPLGDAETWDLRSPLLVLFLAIFLIEALLSRLNLELGELIRTKWFRDLLVRRSAERMMKPKEVKRTQRKTEKQPPASPNPPSPTTPLPPSASRLQSALELAKKGGRTIDRVDD